VSLLKNAKISIRLGLEDYKSNDKRRVISSVRNFHAGVLLLLKEKLRRLSPSNSDEVLIKDKILPKLDANRKIIFVGKGKKTVNTEQIKDRFESLGIKFDWARFYKIKNLRDDIEHYHSAEITGMVSDAFILVRDFVKNELNEDPRSLLGKDVWKTLVTEGEVYKKEREDCKAQLDLVKWESNTLRDAILEYARCARCGSALVTPQDASQPYSKICLKCRSCGKIDNFYSFAVEAISRIGKFENTIFEDTIIEECSSCLRNGLVVSEGKCVFCGEETNCKCLDCREEFSKDELNEDGRCPDCHQLWVSKYI
jgi:hypothetical protein